MTLQQTIEDKAKEYEEYTPKACFEDGANYVASLYSCTPDEVKKMRESLSECLNWFKENRIEGNRTIYNLQSLVLKLEATEVIKPTHH